MFHMHRVLFVEGLQRLDPCYRHFVRQVLSVGAQHRKNPCDQLIKSRAYGDMLLLILWLPELSSVNYDADLNNKSNLC